MFLVKNLKNIYIQRYKTVSVRKVANADCVRICRDQSLRLGSKVLNTNLNRYFFTHC